MLQCSRLNICAFKTFFRKFKIDFPLFIQQATRERVCAYVCVFVIAVRVHTMYEHVVQLNSSDSITYNKHSFTREYVRFYHNFVYLLCTV